jgi:hypothetical protein
VDDGLPSWPDEIKSYGNSVVPAVAYSFAQWIRIQLEGCDSLCMEYAQQQERKRMAAQRPAEPLGEAVPPPNPPESP